VNFRTSFRRCSAVVAGAVIGLGAAFAFIAPASAHTGALTASTSCIVGGWTVRWKLTTTGTDGADGIVSKVTFTHEPPKGNPDVTPKPETLTTFAEGATVTGDGVFIEDQTFGSYMKSAELQFTVTWHDGNDIHTMNLRANVAALTGCPTATARATPPTTAPPGAPAEGAPIPASTTTPPSATASASPTPVLSQDTTGTGGGLPVTGAAAGAITGLAALLLAAGAVLFIVSRRRKVTFTA
jgi:LPXTG-motif cell wall-anchored protein